MAEVKSDVAEIKGDVKLLLGAHVGQKAVWAAVSSLALRWVIPFAALGVSVLALTGGR